MAIILYRALSILVRIIEFLIFVRILLSWLPINRNTPVIRLVYSFTEPILGPIRNLLNKSPLGGPGMMLDFSPIIAFLLLDFMLSAFRAFLPYIM